MRPDFAKAQVALLSPVDWAEAWQRHQVFASRLAEAGHEVFFVENTGLRGPRPRDLARLWGKLKAFGRGSAPGLPENLRLVAPKVLPPSNAAWRRTNSALLIPRLAASLRARGLGPRPLVIACLPTATTLELVRRLDPGALVYDCASNFRAHPAAPADLARSEAELLSRADLVVCDSDYLAEQKRAEHRRVVQVHQGVPEPFFCLRPPDPAFRRLGYFGTWSRDHEPVFLEALGRAGFEVTVHGPVKGGARLPAGTRRSAPVPYEELPRLLERFDVFLLPYRLTPFLQGVVPAKLYECLATGRPVLATPLPCFSALEGLVHVSNEPDQWVRAARSLPQTETPELRRRRTALAREHSQDHEFQRLLQALRAAWEK